MTTPSPDRRVAKTVASAEQQRLTADAAADRRAREQKTKFELAEQKRDADRRAKLIKRADRRKVKDAKRADRRRRVDARVAYCRNNAAAVVSAIVYSCAIGAAIYGQATVGWAWFVAVPIGVALEGFTMSNALTANEQRLQGERAMLPRTLTWVGASLAASINLFGHLEGDPVRAFVLAAVSIIGITVWEIRSGAKHRIALRRLGLIPEPRRTGTTLAFKVRYPRFAWWAWSAAVADPSIRTRSAAISAGLRMRDAHAAAEAQKVRTRVARKVALRAARKGEHDTARTALLGLTDLWTADFGSSHTSVLVAAEVTPVAGTGTTPGAGEAPPSLPAPGPLQPPSGFAAGLPALAVGSGNHAATDRTTDRRKTPATDRDHSPGPVREETVQTAVSRTVRRTSSRSGPSVTNVRPIGTGTDRQMATLRKKFPDRIPSATDIKSALSINSKSHALKLRNALIAERAERDEVNG